MPSKYGFGNTRKVSPNKLATYGADNKNPIMQKKKKKLHLKNTWVGKGLDIVSRVPNLVVGAAADTANLVVKSKKLDKFANKQLNKAYGNEGEDMDYTNKPHSY